MKLLIKREGNNIARYTDFSDIEDRGEIAHIICELKSIEQELQNLWENYDEGELK